MQDKQLLDQEGLGFITQQFAQVGCTINEYHREVGIDAILEIRDDSYKSSGKFVAIQLKSGESFFKHQDEHVYYYYIDDVHVTYWLKCCLPILFIIYNPALRRAFWSRIEKNNLILTGKMYKVLIPKENDLSLITKNILYQMFFGKLYDEETQFEEVYKELGKLRYHETKKLFVSGLELFINGLMDSCKQLYFHTDLYLQIMQKKMDKTDLSGCSFPTNGFFENYFTILNYHNLIQGNFGFETETLNQRLMLPIFIKPLSLNGLKFCDYLRDKGLPISDKFFIYSEFDNPQYFYIES